MKAIIFFLSLVIIQTVLCQTTGTSGTSGTSGTTGSVTTSGSSGSTTGSTSVAEMFPPSSASSPSTLVVHDEAERNITIAWENHSGVSYTVSSFTCNGDCDLLSTDPDIGVPVENGRAFTGFCDLPEQAPGVYSCTGRITLHPSQKRQAGSVTLSYPISYIVTPASLKIATRSTLTLTSAVELGVVSHTLPLTPYTP